MTPTQLAAHHRMLKILPSRLISRGVSSPDDVKASTAIAFQGQVKTVSEWADVYKLRLTTLIGRLARGWSIEESLTAKAQGRGRRRLGR